VLSKSPAAAISMSVSMKKHNEDPGPGTYDGLTNAISNGLK